ncbi:hypothetical protein CRE_23528 [Caenorhabditis remanei]|uniref:Serpentine Receptor, class Z n=1 Tax=Caenorhabditis remanei TaxID=31234 RepID=E3MH75_CAERE|nr:hypothetical protein CRE_23528 [Caenorhabditis remanei]
MDNISSTSNITNKWDFKTFNYLGPFLYVYIFLLFFIFPFYIRIYNMNKERDKVSVVFPIINHFYFAIKIVYIQMCLFTFLIAMILILAGTPLLTLPFIAFFGVIIFTWSVITRVNQLLLSILAIQRFLIYFSPRTEKYVRISENQLNIILVFAYFIFAMEFTLRFILNENNTLRMNIFNLTFNILLYASAILYIPISVSMRKFNYLPAAQVNKPQRYVFWQLLTLVIVKMTFTIVCTIMERDLEKIIVECYRMDVVSIPLIIQLSYLGCNHRTMLLLLSSMKSKSFLKLIFCPCLRDSRVGTVTEETAIATSGTGQPLY